MSTLFLFLCLVEPIQTMAEASGYFLLEGRKFEVCPESLSVRGTAFQWRGMIVLEWVRKDWKVCRREWVC